MNAPAHCGNPIFRSRPTLVHTTAGAALPSTGELLCAMSGQQVRGHVCQWSRDLVRLHRIRRERPQSTAVIDCLRIELVANINAWAFEHLPGRSADLLDTKLGDTIDRIAATADRAFHLLMTEELSGEHMRVAWTRLAELAIAYGDLVRQAESGRWCLSPHTRRR
ncbi:DUF4254 domain-containing protein [Nocardia sp. CA-129566]|uniref:DUF4254 domain-containing protein n=1 Tax=Nocardia sp. CA-129566 TaxID=3239976 RepID=UPI003D97841D